MKQRYLALIILGNLCLAFASAYLLIPSKVMSGGVNGIGVIFEKLFGWDAILTINSCIVLCFICGACVLGKTFALKTIASSILFPVFLQLLSLISLPVVPEVVASVLGGILTGVGIGFVMRAGGSTGGMDVPPLILHKFTNISISTLVLICDAMIVLGGFVVYGWTHVLIGLLSVILCSKALKYVIDSQFHMQNS